MEAPNAAGDYWNSLPWNYTPENQRATGFRSDDQRPPLITLNQFTHHQLEAGFNQLSLSPNPHQSGFTSHIMTRGQSSTAVNDQAPSLSATGGFRQPIGSATMGGYNAFLGAVGSPGINYQGTFYPNIGYSENVVPRIRGESAVIGRRPLINYENNPNPNPNLNRLSPEALYHLSLYHHLLYNNSSTSSSSTSTSNWARFCIDQQLMNNNNNISSSVDMHNNLEGINVYLMARSQHGRRNLQKILEEGMPEKIELIFCQVKDHVHDLMKHQSGNIMIQKMFEVCNAHQITQLIRCLVMDERHLMDVCIDNHGTRAMQKLLGYLTSQEQRHLVLSCLRRITFTLTKDANGHHVIERCLDLFPREETMQILNVVAAHCVDIAANKSGCCLLQHCILNEEAIDPLNRIVAQITANALSLSVDQYGNYVVQYIVGLKMDNAIREIVGQLSGNFVSLSLDKYGSHVVEKCINFCPEDEAMKIIEEIITSQDFLPMLQDPYGNFVAQSALRVSKGSTRAIMVDLIKKHHPFLHSHPHGKRVLDKLGIHPQGRRLLDAAAAAAKTERNRMLYGEA